MPAKPRSPPSHRASTGFNAANGYGQQTVKTVQVKATDDAGSVRFESEGRRARSVSLSTSSVAQQRLSGLVGAGAVGKKSMKWAALARVHVSNAYEHVAAPPHAAGQSVLRELLQD